MVSSISSVSLSREFCLNNRAYNILSKIRDKCIRKRNKDRNKIP